MRVLLLVTLLACQLHSYAADELSGTDPCMALNTSCEDCIKGSPGVSCYLCKGDCLRLDFGGLTSGSCPVEDIKVGQCHLSALALIVVISGACFMLLSGGCVLSGLALYCYCRFCRRGPRAPKTSGRVDTDMREMQERHSQRRSERTARNDETRRKYGLVDEEDTSRYQRF